MKAIWKYELTVEGLQNIKMPVNAQILSVQEQYGKPCLWALVSSEGTEATEERTIETFGTGHYVPVDMGVERKFIGTFQLDDGAFIGHVFERIN